MSSITLVLETTWAWDHSHRNFATYCFEKYEEEKLAQMLEEEHLPDDLLLKTLVNICNEQDGSVMGRAKMVMLYEVQNCLLDQTSTPHEDGLFYLEFKLKPICRFDEDRNPIPVW